MRLIGIDYGTKRIGLALSDEMGKMAFPHIVISAGDSAVKVISKICSEMEVKKIIVGLSLDFSMKENPIMKEVKDFAGSLSDDSGLPVEFHQEFLSSHQAQKEHFEANKEDRSR